LGVRAGGFKVEEDEGAFEVEHERGRRWIRQAIDTPPYARLVRKIAVVQMEEGLVLREHRVEPLHEGALVAFSA
jgi:hypothetical protein